jgi:hypothetical protein
MVGTRAIAGRFLLIIGLMMVILARPALAAPSTAPAKTCVHAAGTGWRFTLCFHQANSLGVVGKATWHGTLPGFLGKNIQHPANINPPPNPSPVLGFVGPFADTASYQLAIGWPALRFVLWIKRSCVPNCAASPGHWVLSLGSESPKPGGVRLTSGQ